MIYMIATADDELELPLATAGNRRQLERVGWNVRCEKQLHLPDHQGQESDEAIPGCTGEDI